MIILDDAHWLDESSLELALAAARSIAEYNLLLLLVQRPLPGLLDELNDLQHYDCLKLKELDPEAIQSMAVDRLGGTVSSLVIAMIQSQSQGNPAFVEQLVSVLAESGALLQEAGVWNFTGPVIDTLRNTDSIVQDLDSSEWRLRPEAGVPMAAIGLPDTLQGAMLARVDHLSEAHRLTLKIASVLGRSFDHLLLAHTHPAAPGVETLQVQLDQLVERGFFQITPDGRFVFAQNALQEVLYNSLSTAQQEHLHARAGGALETLHSDGLTALAYHYTRAGLARRPQALHYLDQVARQAQRNYANQTALNYYRQALALEERWEWRKGQIEVLHLMGLRVEELQALQTLEQSAGAPAEVIAQLFYAYYRAIADYPQAIAAAQRFYTISQARGDWLSEAESLRQIGQVYRRQGENNTALEYYRQAEALFARQQTTPATQHARARLFNSLGWLFYRQNQYEQAQSVLLQALEIARQVEDRDLEVDTLNALGGCATNQNKLQQARQYFESALTVAQATGNRTWEANALLNLGITLRSAGSYAQAIDMQRVSLHLLQATGDRWNETNTLNELGNLYQDIGLFNLAEDAYQKALLLSQHIGDEEGSVYLLINQALVRREQNDLNAAQRNLEDGLALARRLGNTFMEAAYLSQQALLDLRLGRPEETISKAQMALEIRRQLGLDALTTDNLAALAQACLALGQPAQAFEYAGQALAFLEASGGQGQENPLQDYFLVYQVLSALNQPAQAASVLATARALMLERAEHIQDAELRTAYLHNVVVNRAILEAGN